MLFKLVAGHVALDLANTLDFRGDPDKEIDLLGSYRDFLAFAQQSRLLTAAEATRMRRQPPGDLLIRVSKLRESIQNVFFAVATGGTPPAADLRVLNDLANEAFRHRQLCHRGQEFTWEWRPPEDVTIPLWNLALSAVELLTSPDARLVRACQGDSCTWLFLDQSKNHRRRWCDMKACGNRSKARRYYQRNAENARRCQHP